MAKYKAYSEYKDSGVEWLGEVPREWDVINIKYLSQVKRGASPRPIDDPKFFDDDGDYAWVRIADVTASDTYLLETTQKMSALGSSLSVKLEPNKLFLSIAGTVGKPCITAIKSCIHDGFVYFPYLKIPNKFLFYAFSGEQAYKGLGKMGTQLNLNTDTVGGIKVALPSNNYFIANIINFLDYETAKIDNLIEKQKQLIELLKEKRQAVISHAVTKGLNPDVPMKDSGVEWLGDVPEHWNVIKLKYLINTFEQGWSPQCEARLAEKNEYGVLKVGCVNSGCFEPLEHKALPSNLEPQKQYLVKKNDLLISRANTKELVGSSSVVDKDYDNLILCDKLYRLRFNKLANPHLISEFIRTPTVRKQIELSASGASHSMQNIGQDTIKELFVALPPDGETQQIIEFIRDKTSTFDSSIDLSYRQIVFLKERRTALISAAVTGKIDVRDWVAPDTQDIEEPQEATA